MPWVKLVLRSGGAAGGESNMDRTSRTHRIALRLDSMAWLRPDLARAIAWALLIGLAFLPLMWVALSVDGIRHTGVPLAADFTAFWTAARFAWEGSPLLAYRPEPMLAAQSALFPGHDFGYLGFYYPPTFLLAVMPFGALPREAAALVFLGLTLLAYVLALRPLMSRGSASVAALLAFPAVLVVLDYGQNGLLSAALLGAGVALLDRRPVLAGVMFGVLAYKPQLGPLIPLALAAAGRWRAFAAAAGTAMSCAALATLAFGPAIWEAFLDNMAWPRAQMEQGLVDLGRMASVFAWLRSAGASLAAAYVAQALAALAAAICVLRVSRRAPGGRAEGAALVAAIPFVMPYFYEYDAVILAIPMAWLLSEGLRTGFMSGERSILLASFAAPLLASIPGLAGNLFALVAGAALLRAVVRRAQARQNAVHQTGTQPS